MYKNVKPLVPLLSAWEFMPHPAMNQQVPWKKEWNEVTQIARLNAWKEIPVVAEQALKSTAKALVITDADKSICYVSSFFEEMTGYRKKEAVGRKPDFLQGTDTEKHLLEKVRQGLKVPEPVKVTLLNYRKEGMPYYCQIEIFPVFNQQDELVNFLAVEQEVRI